jgi:hypothetical protein
MVELAQMQRIHLPDVGETLEDRNLNGKNETMIETAILTRAHKITIDEKDIVMMSIVVVVVHQGGNDIMILLLGHLVAIPVQLLSTSQDARALRKDDAMIINSL